MTAVDRVGWCPGALRPMASGDGLILRVKPRGGRLTLVQACGIAAVARRFGNGAFDLTQRANLQIRGLSKDRLAPALERLAALGLLDPGPEAEAVRNVVSSPLAGLHRPAVIPDERQRRDDPGSGAAFDIFPCIAALESRLVETAALHALPAKFSFVVDDGGRLGLRDVPADIRFEAFQSADGPAFAVRLGGGEDLAGLCAADDLADAAETLARVFLDAADTGIGRMPDLVTRDGADVILRQAGLGPAEAPRPAAAGPRDAIGPLDVAFGIGAPFGRLDVAQFEAIIAAATFDLRLTPWRTILLSGLTRSHDALAAFAAADLIIDPADPRLAVAACVGAPDCHRATTPVLDHAARLVGRLGAIVAANGIVVHLSGCRKGCAHAGMAPLTLVGNEGRYDLVRDGRAGGLPARRNLDIGEALRCATRELQA